MADVIWGYDAAGNILLLLNDLQFITYIKMVY